MGIFELLAFIKSIGTMAPEIISALVAGLTSAIAVALVIPGDQPEKTLQKIVDFLKKWSKK